jgi:hypothetical protein
MLTETNIHKRLTKGHKMLLRTLLFSPIKRSDLELFRIGCEAPCLFVNKPINKVNFKGKVANSPVVVIINIILQTQDV